jgi:hypothetical protein
MRKHAWMFPFIFAGLINLAACQSSQPVAPPVSSTAPTVAVSAGDATVLPAETPPAQSMPVSSDSSKNGFQELLSYVSPQWIERRNGDVLGAGIQLVDVAQVRRDLSIPPITGADSSKAKVNLILGLNNQGFDVTSIDSKSPSSFQKWGWDVADVDQPLIFRDDYTSIMRGNFDQSIIRDRLEAQGYQASTYGGFTLFLKAGRPSKQEPQFAWKDDTLIIGWEEATVRSLVDRKTRGKPGLDQSAAVQKIMPRLAGAWGAYLVPRGSLDGYARWLQLQSMMAKGQSFYKPWVDARLKQAGQIAWDALAIRWQGKQPTNLQFIYLYPTSDEAQKDVDLVKESVTTAPSFNRNQPWGKVLNLGIVAADDALVVATVTTTNESLLGKAIRDEEWALFAIRNVSTATNTASTPNSAATTSTETALLDSGWIRYTKESEGFALALPPEWLQVDMNPATIDAALKKLANSDPKFKSMLTEQVRSAAANGLKFFGFNVPKDLTSEEIALMNVSKSSTATDMPLETIARAALNQYNELPTVLKPVTLERVQLPAGDARRFHAKLKLQDGTGKAREVELIQYILINGGYPYIISFNVPSGQAETYAPIFEKIVQSFQFVK